MSAFSRAIFRSSFVERTTPILLPFFAVGLPNIRTLVFSNSNASFSPEYEGVLDSLSDIITLVADGFNSEIFGMGRFKRLLSAIQIRLYFD